MASAAARSAFVHGGFGAVVGGGERRGNRFGFDPRVGRGVLCEFQRQAVGVVANLVGVLREPAVDGAVHQARS